MFILGWSSSIVKPVPILIIVIPVLVAIISVVILCVLLVPFISVVVSVVTLFWLFSLLPEYPLLFLKLGLELYHGLYELFLLKDLSKDLLKDPSVDLFVDLVLMAFMSHPETNHLIC